MELFGQALALPSERREAWIVAACVDDAALAEELRRMLAADARPPAALEGGAGVKLLALGADSAEREAPGDELESRTARSRVRGDYRIVRRIGEGGMGVVYEALQSLPQRRVALKVLAAGRTSRRALARFEREAHILGRLHHPNIAQVFEYGVMDLGAGEQACLVMELVDGLALHAHAERQALDTRARAALLATLADAVQHAHSRRVIHRDLKPANILVTREGVPKILDFGVARMTDEESGLDRTLAGQLVGTLAYMSPEQVAGDPDEIDARADVYALGVLAWELFTGAPLVDVEERPLAEIVTLIRERSAPAPSSVRRSLSRDVDAICLKALEKDRERRYASAAELAADLRRFLEDEPVTARAPSMLYVLGKQVRRHRALTALAALALASLAAFAVQSRRFALDSRAEARAANIERGRVLAAFDKLALAEEALWAQHEAQPDARSEWALMELYARHPADLTLRGQRGPLSALSVSRDGRELYAGSHSGALYCVELDTRRQRVFDGLVEHGLTSIAPLDTRRLLLGSGAAQVTVFDLDAGAIAWRVVTRERGRSFVAAAPGARFVAASAPDAAVWLLDSGTGERIGELETSGRTLLGLLASDDGRWLATLDTDEFTVFDAAELPAVRAWSTPVERGSFAAMERGGERVALLVRGRELTVFQLATGRELARHAAPWGDGSDLSFVGERILVARVERPACLDLARGAPIELPTRALGAAFLSCLIDGGARMASAELSGPVRLWDIDAARVVERREPAGDGLAYGQFQPHHGVFVTFQDGSLVQLRRLEDGALLRQVEPSGGQVRTVRIDPQGRWLGVLGADGRTQLAPLDERSELVELRPPNADPNGMRFDPRGGRLAFTLHSGGAQLWRIEPPALLHELDTQAVSGGRLSYSPDGRALAIALGGGKVQVWSTDDGQLRSEWTSGHAVGVLDWLTPESLVLTDFEGSLVRRDAATGSELARYAGHSGAVTAVSLSLDGRWLASTSFDGTLRVWDFEMGAERAHFDAQAGRSRGATFSPDGQRLWAHFADGVSRCWNLARLRERVAANRPVLAR